MSLFTVILDWVLMTVDMSGKIFYLTKLVREDTSILMDMMTFLIANDVLCSTVILIHDIPSYFLETPLSEYFFLISDLGVFAQCLPFFYGLLMLPIFSILNLIAIIAVYRFVALKKTKVARRAIVICYVLSILMTAPLLSPCCGFGYIAKDHYWNFDFEKTWTQTYKDISFALQVLCMVIVLICMSIVLGYLAKRARSQSNSSAVPNVLPSVAKSASSQVIFVRTTTLKSGDSEQVAVKKPLRQRSVVDHAFAFCILSLCFITGTLVFNFLPGGTIVSMVITIITANLNRSKWIIYCHVTKAQDIDCSKAPNPGVKAICLQIVSWDLKSKNVKQPPAAPFGSAPFSENPAGFSTDVTLCRNITCVCNANSGSGDENCILPDGTLYKKIMRKEIRQMTDEELSNYVSAMWAVKQNGDYQDLSMIHSSVTTSPGAHSGPSFMPWHREFLKRLEMALRKINAAVFIPYWDSTIDRRLPNPVDSCLWHPDLFGYEDDDGQVRNGLFANWTSLDGTRFTRRKRGNAGALFTPADLIAVLNQTTVVQVLANTAPRQGCPQRASWNVLEYIHGNPHIWVGGDMVNLTISTNDPMFFCHHSFVDFIWEKWRLAKQTRGARETAYPSDNLDCHREAHNRDNPMRPFLPFNNIDGCSNQYTDSLYSYAPQPTCSSTNINGCNSKFLFCDLSNGTAGCAPKIVLGGNCANFTNNEDCCYKGVCVDGVCVVPSTPAPTTAPPSTNCFNSDVCCASWASRGECRRNVNYMNNNCPASCGWCNPSYDITTECSDRSPRCSQWGNQGACDDSEDWMRENCRASCDFCDTTRAEDCLGVATTPSTTTTTMTTTTRAPMTTCLNNNVCCQTYSQSTCSDPEFSNYMRANCAPTCGYCTPPRNWNQCVDLSPGCRSWAANGFCRTSAPFMLENCKVSCDSCYLLNRNNRRDECNSRNNFRARNLLDHLSLSPISQIPKRPLREPLSRKSSSPNKSSKHQQT